MLFEFCYLTHLKQQILFRMFELLLNFNFESNSCTNFVMLLQQEKSKSFISLYRPCTPYHRRLRIFFLYSIQPSYLSFLNVSYAYIGIVTFCCHYTKLCFHVTFVIIHITLWRCPVRLSVIITAALMKGEALFSVFACGQDIPRASRWIRMTLSGMFGLKTGMN